MSGAEAASPDVLRAPAHDNRLKRQRVAVLVPCFNEQASIAKVVKDFRATLPEAVIYVYDNNSTDRTAELARAAGAGASRNASGQRQCRAPYVCRCRGGHLRAGGRRRDLSRAERARYDRAVVAGAARHGGGRPGRPGAQRVPAGASDGKPPAYGFFCLRLRRDFHGYSLRVSGVLRADT